MHYTGIMAIKLTTTYTQSNLSIFLSFLFALLSAAVVAAYNPNWIKKEYNLFSYKKMTIILLITASVTIMHYTAMGGTTFSEPTHYEGELPLLNDSSLVYMVCGAFLLIISLFIRVLYKERKIVMTKARYYEQHYMTLFQFSPDMVICIDPVQKGIVSVNPAVFDTIGYSKEELMFDNGDIFNEEDKRVMYEAVQKAANGIASKLQISIMAKSGVSLVCSMTVFPLQADQQYYVYLVAKDVTENIRFQEELIIAKEAAEGAARMKSEFLATMSHEIRTPLNGIIGINDLLADELRNPDQLELLRLQAKSSQALLKVIDDVLELSSMEGEVVHLHEAPFRINTLIQECMDLFSVNVGDKNIHLEYHLSEDIPELLIGDAARIRQILVNLIGNAVKFTPYGTVSLTIEPYSEASSYNLMFKVKDTGIGLDSDKIKLLFLPFTQLDAAHNRKFAGIGLGLAICKKLVTLMNGEIWAFSPAEGGAEFIFRIPMKIPESNLPRTGH